MLPDHNFAGRFPRYPGDYLDLRGCITKFVLPGFIPDQPPITHKSSIMTLGSCFSRHIGENLAKRGMDVRKIETTEAATTPDLVRQILRDNMPKYDIDCLIITLGIGEGTLRDNINQIWDICRLAGLSRIPHLVMTVSPATMNRSVIPSTVVADCLSKSLLRIAVDQAIKEWPSDHHDHEPTRVHYWPSFEIVRWLGAHLQRSMYGGTDGVCRHVDMDVVEIIMDLWCHHYVAPLQAN